MLNLINKYEYELRKRKIENEILLFFREYHWIQKITNIFILVENLIDMKYSTIQ